MTMEKPIPASTLLVRTRALLKDDPRTTLEIHIQSGISFYWLRKFRFETGHDPGVSRVQKLYEFLTNTKLDV